MRNMRNIRNIALIGLILNETAVRADGVEYKVDWAKKVSITIAEAKVLDSETTFAEAEKRARKSAVDTSVEKTHSLCVALVSKNKELNITQVCDQHKAKIGPNTASKVTEYTGRGTVKVSFETSLSTVYGDVLPILEKLGSI